MVFSKAVLAVVAAAALAAPGTAMAKDGDPAELNTSGACSAGSTWKLDVKERDGGLEVEFEVDENRVGSRWSYEFFRSGTSLGGGTAETVAPSGSFSVERRVAGATISVPVSARATNSATGETCASEGAPAGSDDGSGSGGGSDDGSGSESGDDSSTGSGSGASSGGAKRKAGTCSAGSRWKLKAKSSDGRVEVEFEVDSDRSGQKWSYRLKKGKRNVASGRTRTRGASGSFSVEKKVSKSGSHRIRAGAENLGSGETCTAKIRY